MKNHWLTLASFALTGLFFACSSDDSIAGGATEGTNGFAINDTIFVRDTISRIDTVTTIDTLYNTDTVFVNDSFAISQKNIAGRSQKGPFIKGSPVTVLELNERAIQTGKAFRGKVGDKGEFEVVNLNLKTNYAILEATGYYWNEVSGKMSNAPITLNAIADLSDRENVNVNILTELEYERVMKLVEKDSLSLADAKKQAKKEILKAFYGSGEEQNLEDLDIFGNGEDDALLLAVSVMLLASHTEAELTELLYSIAKDLREDGVFSDSTLRAEIADQAAFKMNLPNIRKNMLSWEGVENIPNFEKYIDRYWTSEYKLESCSDGNEGKVMQNGNTLSHRNAARFVCKNGSWQVAYYNPDVDYNLITDERDGQVYRTVQIGDQVWMAENMRYKPNGAHEESSCYDDDEKNCKIYGRLYSLEAAMVSCPAGFHLPSEAEWKVLADFAGGDSIAAPKLRAVGSWDAYEHPDTKNDTDEYGFSALPAGVYYFGAFGAMTYFWTDHVVYNKETGAIIGAYNVAIADHNKIDFGGNAYSSTRISLRCLKDSE